MLFLSQQMVGFLLKKCVWVYLGLNELQVFNLNESLVIEMSWVSATGQKLNLK